MKRQPQANLNAVNGTVTARDQPGDKCPNCDSPLWRSSWKQDAHEMLDRATEQMERAKSAESRAEQAERALADQIAFRERDKDEIAQLRETVDKLTNGTDNGALCIEIGNQSAQLAAKTSEIGGLRRALAEAVEVLRPFTSHYSAWMDQHDPETQSSTFPRHTFAQLNAARQFVKEHGKP